MRFQRTIINLANRFLTPLNLQLDSLTSQRIEKKRLDRVAARDNYSSPIYPTPECFENSNYQFILDALPSFDKELDCLACTSDNAVGYQYANGFYRSPDTEVLYTIVRTMKPKKILEMGCGNSTRVSRQAVIDGDLDTKISCIDPFPRRDVSGFADEVELSPVEDSKAAESVRKLTSGDILFIDTSHIVLPANDCAYIFCVLLPLVPSGTIVHIHDIFLPYEYPESLMLEDGRTWGEQYLVSVMLQGTSQWEVLWPGHYLQRNLEGFEKHFPRMGDGFAQSLWLRKTE